MKKQIPSEDQSYILGPLTFFFEDKKKALKRPHKGHLDNWSRYIFFSDKRAWRTRSAQAALPLWPMVRCRYILRVTLVYVSFSSFWFSFLTRARARARRTQPKNLNCADFYRTLGRASLKGRHLLIWILRRKRCTSTSFHSKEFARASRFYLRTLHLRLSLSLSLSPVQKGGERRDNSIFFRNSNLGNWEKKGGKENRRAKVRNAFFFIFVLDEFWDDTFVLLCVKWRRRPSKNMSTMWSLALSR